MRCLSCNERLNNREACRKYSSSGTFVDLCDSCFKYVADEVPVIDEPGDYSDDIFDDGSDVEFNDNEFGDIDGQSNNSL